MLKGCFKAIHDLIIKSTVIVDCHWPPLTVIDCVCYLLCCCLSSIRSCTQRLYDDDVYKWGIGTSLILTHALIYDDPMKMSFCSDVFPYREIIIQQSSKQWSAGQMPVKKQRTSQNSFQVVRLAKSVLASIPFWYKTMRPTKNSLHGGQVNKDPLQVKSSSPDRFSTFHPG